MALTVDKAHFPVSDATNAYDLLTDIAHLAMNEPERFDMGTWIEFPRLYGGREKQSSCGTVGCIGGWAETILTRRMLSLEGTNATALSKARRSAKFHTGRALGLTMDQEEELFFDSKLCGEHSDSYAQTCAHAKAVKTHIERFQRKYERQLRRTKV